MLSSRPLKWLVVRRAQVACELNENRPLKVNQGLLYQGPDRLPWWDIESAYWSSDLSEKLFRLYDSIRSVSCATEMRATDEVSAALKLLHVNPTVASRNEVVCAVEPPSEPEDMSHIVEWLGFDPIYRAPMPYTLLSEAYLVPSSPLCTCLGHLNENGLFTEADQARDFVELYRELSFTDQVEPLPLFDEAVKVLYVGRLVTST